MSTMHLLFDVIDAPVVVDVLVAFDVLPALDVFVVFDVFVDMFNVFEVLDDALEGLDGLVGWNILHRT